MQEFIDIIFIQEGYGTASIYQGDLIKITNRSIYFENRYGVKYRLDTKQNILINQETGVIYPVKKWNLW